MHFLFTCHHKTHSMFSDWWIMMHILMHNCYKKCILYDCYVVCSELYQHFYRQLLLKTAWSKWVMKDKNPVLPSSTGSAHGPTESTDRNRTQRTTTLKTPCAPPHVSFERWQRRIVGNVVRTENKHALSVPAQRHCILLDDGTEMDEGADITEDDGFYTRCLAPVAQDTNREF